MSATNLRDVLAQLRSEKIKERQDGLSSIKAFFAADKVIRNFDAVGDGKAWLVVYQALFTTVALEKKLLTGKKATSTAERRLGDAASFMRSLAERSTQRLNGKVIKALFTHFTQVMVHEGALLPQVSLDYAKAMRSLLAWTPHKDHLDKVQWLSLVEMCFNVILGDEIRKGLDDEDSQESLENEEDEVEEMMSEVGSPKKRRYASAIPTLKSTQEAPAKSRRLVTQEQMEFMAILSLLFQTSSTPLLSPDYSFLPHAIFTRLLRLLRIYSADSSLQHDYLVSLNALLAQLALNCKDIVSTFAASAWDDLVSMWHSKTRGNREVLLSVLLTLYPYYINPLDTDVARVTNGVGKLAGVLAENLESRKGVDCLDMETLHLGLVIHDDTTRSLHRRTFQAATGFDSNNALTWATIMLHADCLAYLSEHGEWRYIQAGRVTKRTKVEDPALTLLGDISSTTASSRIYRLQLLLFYIDRHWPAFSEAIQREVVSSLIQVLASEDAAAQNVSFMCLAAAADACFLANWSVIETSVWDQVWATAVRKMSHAAACRFAGHCASTLLKHSKCLLSSVRVTQEIETFMSDLEVHGPPGLQDAVSTLFTEILSYAHQDARLYHLKLEDKLLSWLPEVWRNPTECQRGARARQLGPLHHVPSSLHLLETVCGLQYRSLVPGLTVLPDSVVVDSLELRDNTAVIRDFLLCARLPGLSELKRHSPTSNASVNIPATDSFMVASSNRERRTAALMLKLVEEAADELEEGRDGKNELYAEEGCKYLDLAVVGMIFSASLLANGVRPNRRVLQLSSRIVSRVLQKMSSSRWTTEEKATTLRALAPLVTIDDTDDVTSWEPMVPPSSGTGIRREALSLLLPQFEQDRPNRARLSVEWRRHLWHDHDVQLGFAAVLEAVQNLLSAFLGQAPTTATSSLDKDFEFTPRSGPSITLEKEKNAVLPSRWRRSHIQLMLAVLTVVPVMQLANPEFIRDRDLFDAFVNCGDHHFLNHADLYFRNFRQHYISLSSSQFNSLLERFESLLIQYPHSRSEYIQILLIKFLDYTMPYWLQPSVMSSETGGKTRELCHWLAQMLNGQKIRSWKTRDRLCQFLHRYVELDPFQNFWRPPQSFSSRRSQDDDVSMDESSSELPNDFFPCFIIPRLGSDDDIRVRFRVATISPRLLATAQHMGQESMEWYEEVKKWLSQDLDSYEHMLTRFLCLGNIMITSSSVRRAPYWHLLETVFHESRYSYAGHLSAVLKHVSQRMGLVRYAQLFEAYAPQIAYSIRQGGYRSLQLSPSLLGYDSIREYADASFHAFAPAYLSLENPGSDAAIHGKDLFVNHCQRIKKSPAEGIVMCFGDIVGHAVVTYIDDHIHHGEPASDIDAFLANILSGYDVSDVGDRLEQYADEIITAILHTLGEQNFLPDGPIAGALRRAESANTNAIHAYGTLVLFRRLEDFAVHTPNLPTFSSEIVIQAVEWAKACTKVDNFSVSYHVVQQLFADILDSCLVNEQLRLLNALTMWIAYHCEHFQDCTLLRVLLNGSATLLTQYDLATGAQSILSWCFGIHRSHDEKMMNFPDVLLFLSSTIHGYITSSQEDIKQRGHSLAKWIHQEIGQFAAVPSLREQIVKKVLPAWSLELDTDLALMVEDVTSADISDILEDSRISTSKFRLVKRMRDLAKATDSAPSHFNFWRLKECIPEINQLQFSDISAFAELLITRQGRIVSLGDASSVTQGVRYRHRLNRSEKETSITTLTQKPIVTSLRDFMENPSVASLRATYRTLRYLLADRMSSDSDFRTWPSEYRTELRYIAAFPRNFELVSQAKLNDLLGVEGYQSVADFRKWVTSLSAHLSDVLAIERQFFRSLGSHLRQDPTFAEEVLPVLVHSLLLSQVISPGEEDVRGILSSYLTAIVRNDTASLSCLRSIVDIVLHLREFPVPRSPDLLSYDKWLDLDFNLLSRTAIKCGAYTTALLFLELRAEHNIGHEVDISDSEDVYYDIYSHIEEPDGFYGVQTKDLQSFLLRRFEHENEWDKAFRFYGAAAEANPQALSHTQGMVSALHSFGFNHLAMVTLGRNTATNESVSSQPKITYEIGWRTGTWDLPEVHDPTSDSPSLYIALRAVHQETNSDAIDATLKSAFNTEMERLRQLGTENIKDIRQVLQSVMCLRQVTEWQEALRSRSDLVPWLESDQLSGRESNFVEFEAMMSTRMALLRSARSRVQREQIGTLISPTAQRYLDAERKSLLQVAAGARESGHLQVALNAVIRAQSLETHVRTTVVEESSAVFWSLREQTVAIQSLKQLALPPGATQTQMDGITSHALVLARLGQWTSEAGLERPADVLGNYFNPAVSSLPPLDQPTSRAEHARVYYQFAVFAERQYQDIKKSSDTARYIAYVEISMKQALARKAEVKHTQQGSSSYSAAVNLQRKAEKALKEDRNRLEQHTRTLRSFREQAVEMFSRCMSVSDDFDEESIMRFISLWFDNFGEAALYSNLRPAVDRVASRKFVFLAHQLSARLSSDESTAPPTQVPSTQQSDIAQSREGQSILKSLVLRMCREHPFHSVYQVYCIQPEVDRAASHSRRQSGRVEAPSSQLSRETAATEIFSILHEDKDSRHRVMAVERLCNASLQWAKHPIKKELSEKRKKGPLSVPDTLLIRKIHDIRAPVSTARTPLDPTMRYDDCVWVVRYDSTFQTAGGVNLPKISTCLGSDGTSYKQLFKGEGNDDMRQDAVMEQVFEVVNRILHRDLETKKRNLRVRDYKVIPLAPRAGLLEFVSNTMPMQAWLWEAHAKYRPGDLKHAEVDSALRQKHRDETRTPDAMLKLFQDLRARFQPVFRHYFTERRKTPSAWFAMRLAYTRSVATTSIVGHIIGLGDRHCSNILLDNASGEVVHIDLGIAFDQGKKLPVPERVPFRMTADMIDGMGISGTQGVFQRCAEETLRVLRDGSSTINTVLGVFRHDPLHTWTVSGERIGRVQGKDAAAAAAVAAAAAADEAAGVGMKATIGIDGRSTAADQAADRALSAVEKKLEKSLSVEYTVNELLAEATDPLHLATMFPGWGPQY